MMSTVTSEKSVLDSIDRTIIGILVEDGRISWKELGDRVHLAPSSVADRVRRLETLGVIAGYSAGSTEGRSGCGSGP